MRFDHIGRGVMKSRDEAHRQARSQPTDNRAVPQGVHNGVWRNSGSLDSSGPEIDYIERLPPRASAILFPFAHSNTPVRPTKKQGLMSRATADDGHEFLKHV